MRSVLVGSDLANWLIVSVNIQAFSGLQIEQNR